MARMDRWNRSPATRKNFTKALKSRSFQVLDAARALLNGEAPEHRTSSARSMRPERRSAPMA